MSLTYGFYNSIEGDRVYDATQFGQIFDGIIKDGVYATYEKGMVVIASTNPGEVIIQPGRAWFNHTWSHNDANVIFPAPEPEVLLDRIDALVLEINEELAARENSFKWVTGTPSSVPERPTLTNTPTIHQYPLCYIHRYPETTIIQTKDITNMVGTSECPFATGVLEGIDLDAWINQWDDEFHNWENTTKSTFETWMLNQEAVYTAWADALKSQMDADVEDVEAWIESIKDIIDSETATHLQNEIDELREEITSGSHIFIHTINSELYGRNVTITTEEGITYTERFDNSGVAEFKSIPYVGNLNVVSSYGTQTAEAVINTPYFARYTFQIAFWAATCNIVGIPDYAGQTVTIKDSASVIAGTVVLDSDGNGVFTAIRPDTYTFTLIYGGETMETTLSVTQETTYTVEIHSQSSIDLQGWLTAGGVTGTYNTFADVEADEKAVRKLMTIHDAVDYLAQSDGTDELISEVINSDICAKWINLRDYALDTLSANTDIKALMDTADKYGYGEWVLVDDTTTPPTYGPKGNVPIMTSNTAPYGEVTSSNSASDAYILFDGASYLTTRIDLTGTDHYIAYKFANPICVKAFGYAGTGQATGNEYYKGFTAEIEISNDGTNWESVHSHEWTKEEHLETYRHLVRYEIDNDKYALYARFRMTTNNYTYQDKYMIGALQFYGREMKVSVPTMTSNTAPYGQSRYVSGQRYSSDSYEAYRLFDKNNNIAATTGVPSASSPHILAYSFGYPVVVKEITFKEYGNSSVMPLQSLIKDFVFIGSNDNFATYDELGTFESVSVSGKIYTYTINNNTPYKAYGIKATSNNGYSTYTNFGTMGNFYGFDYSEYDWDTNAPRHYLYDHGVELEEFDASSNTNKLPYEIDLKGSSGVSVCGVCTHNMINLTGYAQIRGKIGSRYVYAGNSNDTMQISIDDYNMVRNQYSVASTAYRRILPADLPDNIYLDISNTTTSYYVECIGASNSVIGSLKELWLE